MQTKHYNFYSASIFFSYLRIVKACYLFNPEHDLALANGDRHFIAPRNIREMARDLAPLMNAVEDSLQPWGWDLTIKTRLLDSGISEEELPTDKSLAALRDHSGRATAHHLLSTFRREHPADVYTGESLIASSIDEIAAYAARHGHILLKAPLSGSGKGLRHVNLNENEKADAEGASVLERVERFALTTTEALASQRSAVCSPFPSGQQLASTLKKVESWTTALIRRHGYLTAEPYYNKVQDFAMEFRVADGQCHFIGYSLFVTDRHGRYDGNRLMSDAKIEELLATHIPREALHETRHWITAHYTDIIPAEWDITRFPLYFGVDMMIVDITGQQSPTVSGERLEVKGCSKLALHPCVEINLRMNMGIIAHEIYRQCLVPEAEGLYRIAIFADNASLRAFSAEQAALHPATYRNGRLIKGYLPLTPIEENTRHHAYVVCE